MFCLHGEGVEKVEGIFYYVCKTIFYIIHTYEKVLCNEWFKQLFLIIIH